MDFVVIDTEGRPELREIAIVNSHGKLIYEAFSQEHPHNAKHIPNLKSLKTLLIEFLNIVDGKKIVCHYAKHDLDVLKYSFRKAGLNFPKLDFECTWNLATNYWQGLESYSLENLSKYLNLRVRNRYFMHDMAHSARYDAEFTYYLYSKLMTDQLTQQASFDSDFITEEFAQQANLDSESMTEQLKQQPNPFNSSRVDNPFQTHPDYTDTYRNEFLTLESILDDIKLDSNRQSKGVVLIGEPGTGKTHLMMRLAQARLSSNRLLFIRHPNNPKTIIHHIHSRILESLVQRVDSLTQLDYLIIKSFKKILNERIFFQNKQKIVINRNFTQKDQDIIKAFEEKNLDFIGADGTKRKREYWEYIEKRISEWWINFYSPGGFALPIIKGITKYCSYSDYEKKEITTRWLAGQILSNEEAEKVGLPNWPENLSQEAFALEAITVLGKLSILDEPLIIIFDELEGLGLPHNQEILLNFGEAVKELFTHVPNSLIILNLFPDRWEQFETTFDNSIIGRVSQRQIYLHPPNAAEIQEILRVKLQPFNLSLEQLFKPEDLEDILEHTPIRNALNRAADYYNYRVRQIPLPSRRKSFHKPKQDEEITTQIRLLKQQQQELKEAFTSLLQEFHQPGSVNLTNLVRQYIPDAPNPRSAIEDYIVDYLSRKQLDLERQYTNVPIISDADDIGKLKTIAEAFKYLKPIQLTHYRFGKRVLPEHIVVETEHKNYAIGFLQIAPHTSSFTSRISNFHELLVLNPQDSFTLFRDERLTEVRGRVAKENIEQLNRSPNGKFHFLTKPDRIHLELTYQLIIDIQNRDLDIDLESALKVLVTQPEWYHWIFDLFGFSKPN